MTNESPKVLCSQCERVEQLLRHTKQIILTAGEEKVISRCALLYVHPDAFIKAIREVIEKAAQRQAAEEAKEKQE